MTKTLPITKDGYTVMHGSTVCFIYSGMIWFGCVQWSEKQKRYYVTGVINTDVDKSFRYYDNAKCECGILFL